MSAKEKTELRKVRILKAATKVFAQKGFHEGTIPEIAKKAAVSEASIYDYFTTKENLLFSIPHEAICRLRDASEFHLKLVKGSANKLRAMLYMQVLFYRDNRDFAAVLMLILKQNRRFLDAAAHKTIRNYLKIIDRIIAEGMETGEFRNDIDPYLLRSSCVGALEHVITNWLMLGHPDDDGLLEMVDPMVKTLVKGIRNEKPPDVCPFQRLINPEEINADNS